MNFACKTSDPHYFKLQYDHDIAVFAQIAGFFVLAVAMPLFIVVAVRRRLNWTVSFLFISAFCFFLFAAFGTAFHVRKTPRPDWGYYFIFSQVFALIGHLFRHMYLYRRCATLIPALTKRFALRRMVHIFFFALIFAHLGVSSANAFVSGQFLNVNGTNVWQRVNIYPALLFSTLWLNSLVDVLSCAIILGSILITFHIRNPLGTKRHTLQTKILDIIQASECRIVLVLLLSITQTIITYVIGFSEFEFHENAILNNYMVAAYMMLLLIDSSLMLLTDVGGRANGRKNETFLVWDNDRNGWMTVDKSARRGLPGTGLGAQQPLASPGPYTTGRSAPSSPFLQRNFAPSRSSLSPSDTPRTPRAVNFETDRSNASDSPLISMTSLQHEETATQWGSNVLGETVVKEDEV